LTFLGAVFPLVELAKGNVGGEEGAMPVPVVVLCLVIGFGIPFLFYCLMGDLRTRVTTEGIHLSWGFAELIRKNIPIEEIEAAEAVTYSPIGDFGGWGIRMGGDKKRAWTVSGKRALLLHLSDGTRFYVGSAKPERILQWVMAAMKRSDV
jgi:hypothetical protein